MKARFQVRRCSKAFALALILPFLPAQADQPELFDLAPILNEPLQGVILNHTIKEGIVIEEIEFTSRTVENKPERVRGILAYPEGGKSLPAIFWSMGGMSPANSYFAGLFARKGYACLSITLPHPIRRSQERFNVDHPAEANFTLLAKDQLRGITYLSQRSEVDPERIGVGGASYGGVFATLIAGIDPRIKAGVSFFGGGHHELGTNLPQFTKLRSLEEVAKWNQTVDPAFRHRTRSVPFLWAVAFNDNWFHFPAVIKTYEEAVHPGKRLAIIPHWQHGFPENVDQQIVDFFDTTLTTARAPYNLPGKLELSRSEDGGAQATFHWEGKNAVKKAELIVSYGEVTPWYGWLHRASFVFPAEIDGVSAHARLPLPSGKLPLIAWGNITDANDVITSTPPLILTARELSSFRVDSALKLNCVIDGALGKEAVDFYQRNGGKSLGTPDPKEKRTGSQSLRLDRQEESPGLPEFSLPLLHSVPGVAHRLEVWIRSDSGSEATLSLLPIRPKNWGSPVVAQLVSKDARLQPLLVEWSTPPEALTTIRKIGTEWEKLTLEVPLSSAPVEGYDLKIKVEGDATSYWVDSIFMEPLWP